MDTEPAGLLRPLQTKAPVHEVVHESEPRCASSAPERVNPAYKIASSSQCADLQVYS